jgi:hypothetical protein
MLFPVVFVLEEIHAIGNWAAKCTVWNREIFSPRCQVINPGYILKVSKTTKLNFQNLENPPARLYPGKKHPFSCASGSKNRTNTMDSRVAGQKQKTTEGFVFFLLYNLCSLTGRDGVLLQHGHSGHSVLPQETCPHYFQHYTASVFLNNLKKFVRNGKERVSATIF